MSEDHDHEGLMEDAAERLKPLFEGSEQSMYLYLDDHQKICNRRFSTLLGYKTPKEWAEVQQPFTEAFVEGQSQRALVTAYGDAMEKLIGSAVDVTWKKKGSGSVKSKVILVPYLHEGHLFALHFIS